MVLRAQSPAFRFALICLMIVACGISDQWGSSTAHAQEQSATPSIGGRFMLQNHNGQIITDQDYRGKFMLITFGYTYCPDICPTNLVNMSEALAHLDSNADKIAPLFVTVDPSRDTAERLRDYVSHFDERLIGLTGSQPLIDNIIKRYKVIAEIHKPKNWQDEDYLVDHSASIYLMSPGGQFLVKFAHGMDPQHMAKRISDFM